MTQKELFSTEYVAINAYSIGNKSTAINYVMQEGKYIFVDHHNITILITVR